MCDERDKEQQKRKSPGPIEKYVSVEGNAIHAMPIASTADGVASSFSGLPVRFENYFCSFHHWTWKLRHLGTSSSMHASSKTKD